MYQEGYGVTVNYEKAIYWYKKAIDQGDADSMYFLGMLYLEGKGVDKSLPDAAYWINLARQDKDGNALTAKEEAEKIWTEKGLSKYLKK